MATGWPGEPIIPLWSRKPFPPDHGEGFSTLSPMNHPDYYYQMPRYFNRALSGLSCSAVRTFLAIAEHCYGDKEVAHPSIRRIVDITGLSRRSVINGKEELANAGLLKVQHRKNEKRSNDANVYKIHKPWTHAAPSVENRDKLSTGVQPTALGGVQPTAPKEKELKEVTVTVTQSSDIPIPDTVTAPSPPRDAGELITALARKASTAA